MQTSGSREIFRFRDFELDVAAYELRRHARPFKLGRQPMDLLILLVEQRRRLVSRNEIVDRLWGKDVFVDVETGVNTTISKIRQALRDAPDAPVFVETVPGKGYRFIAPVDVVTAGPTPRRRPSRSRLRLRPRPNRSSPATHPRRARIARGLRGRRDSPWAR